MLLPNIQTSDSVPVPPPDHVEIVEGTARMWYDAKEAVFYNKVQVLNRDLLNVNSVLLPDLKLIINYY